MWQNVFLHNHNFSIWMRVKFIWLFQPRPHTLGSLMAMSCVNVSCLGSGCHSLLPALISCKFCLRIKLEFLHALYRRFLHRRLWAAWVSETLSRFRYKLMLKCWNENPKERPSFGEIEKELETVLSQEMVGQHSESFTPCFLSLNIFFIVFARAILTLSLQTSVLRTSTTTLFPEAENL